MTDCDISPPRAVRRNWLSVSLRSLLVLFTLAAVWMAIVANRAREQQRVVTGLSQYPGAMIMYDHEWDLSAGGEIPRPRPLGPPPGPAWLRERLGDEYFRTVIGVFLTGPGSAAHQQPDAAALSLIGDLPGLRVLSLEKSAITDEGLATIANQPELIYLWLDDTAISDAGLAQLRQMRKLKFLYLRNSNVTGAGIDSLKRDLPQVRICYGRGSPETIK